MASENETHADIVKEMRYRVETNERAGIHPGNCRLYAEWANRIEAAHKREVAELRGALKKAYGTLYSISCARYGEGLTCTDDIHELVTMAKECSDALYENENLRKALKGEKNG